MTFKPSLFFPVKSIYIALFACLLIVGINAAILSNPSWIYGDDHIFMLAYFQGRAAPLFLTMGRFYPLGFQEFNLLALLPDSREPSAYYLVVALVFNLTMVTLIALYRYINGAATNGKPFFGWSGLFVLVLLLWTPDFVSVYLNVIYPEKLLMLFLSLFMLFYLLFVYGNDNIHGLAAVVFAALASYCKEPAFSIFMVIGGMQLLFRFRELPKNQKVFYGLLLLNGVIFLTLYYFLSFRHSELLYKNSNGMKWSYSALQLIHKNPLFVLMAALSLWRAGVIVFCKNFRFLAIDVFLFAAVAWVCGYMAMNFFFNYYYAPTYLMGLPAILFYLNNGHISRYFRIFLLGMLIVLFPEVKNVKYAIEINQYKRQMFLSEVKSLTDNMEKEKQILWLDDMYLPAGPKMIHWKQGILEVIYRYRTGHVRKLFHDVYEVPKRLSPSQMLAVPEISSKGRRMNEEIDNLNKNPNFKYAFSIWGIRVYESGKGK